MSRKTVNGIKVKDVDERTRAIISRAGDIEEQVLKTIELDVLDKEFYSKFFNGLRRKGEIKQVLKTVALQVILGYSIVNLCKAAIYILV